MLRLYNWILIGFLCLWLLHPASCQPLFSVEQTATAINVFHASGKPLLSVDKQHFIEAVQYTEKVKSRYGSFSFKQRNRKTFQQISNLQLLDFGNSLFITGQVGNKQQQFPFELGLIGETNKPEEVLLTLKLTDSSEKMQAVALISNHRTESIYGFGEQFSYTDFKGKKLSCFTEENGIGRGDQPLSAWTSLIGIAGQATSSYFPLPVFFTGDGTTYTGTPSLMTFDFSKQDKIRVESALPQPGGKHLLNIKIDWRKNALLPEPHTLPDWAYGTILGLQGGKEKVEKIVYQALDQGNPVKAIWIQDWLGKRRLPLGSRLWWKWEVDSTQYPQMKNWIAEWNRKNIKVLGYINSFIIKESRWYAEAVSKNFLIKNKTGKNYSLHVGGFDAYLVDLSNEAACNWFKQIIKTQLIDLGFSGWMADFGEYLPLDARLSNGYSGRDFHNFYAVAWARINREAAQEAGLDDSLLIFHRSGNSGSNHYVKMFWTGDQTPDFGEYDGLPSAIRAVLTSAATGTLYNHSDIGGYTNVDLGRTHIQRTRELLYRWIEFATFTPFFRTHEGLKPEKNIQVYSDAEAVSFFARMGKLHYALKTYAQENVAQFGRLIYPLYIHPGFTHHETQYLYGTDLLIAPVSRAGQQIVEVKFPEGNWLSVWNTEKRYTADITAHFPVPLGQPAVFIREGGKWEKQLKAIFER